MFCTGGLDEKASVYLKNKGLERFPIKGGVLNYLDKVEKKIACGMEKLRF